MTSIEDLDPAFLRARFSAKWSSFGADILPSNPAEMDFGVAPAIQSAMRQMVERQQYGYSTRGPGSAATTLIEAFSRRMRNKFGWAGVEPDRVVVLNDLVQAVMASILAFSDPQDGVVLQVPSYPAFLAILAQSGRRTVVNPMIDAGERFELDIENIAAVTTPDVKVLLLCHPHNPTGRVFTKAELAPLARIAIERDMVVVSDEIHADLLLDGRQHIPFAQMFPEAADRTVTLYSATKSYNIPGLRTALMHFGSESLLERFQSRIPPFLLGTPASPGVFATIAAWEEEASKWGESLIGVLERSRDHMMARFAAELPEVRMHRPEATYLAWADFSAFKLQDRPYAYLLEKALVAGGDGRNFGPGYEQCVRLNFATSQAILDEKIDRLVRAVRMNKAS